MNLSSNILLYPIISVYMQGIAMGCVVGGFGGGALVFNFIQVAASYLLGGH